MKKIIIISSILGILFGYVNYLVFSLFKEELYSNLVLQNLYLISLIVVVFLLTFFIIRALKRSENKED